MSVIDNAIDRLQTLALASTDLTIKHAPSKPISDGTVMPFSIAHLAEGEGTENNASTMQINAFLNVDFHFSAISLKQAYTEIQACASEYLRRLGGDPTLNGTVDTIVFPVSFSVSPELWDSVQTIMLRFVIPIKTLETPIT